jgi:PAS domain S-box-containing protein
MPSKIKLLLVDDKPSNLVALDAVLGRTDYDLIFANSGAEALEQLKQHKVALVLLDIQMPGMDGFETARRIKQLAECQDVPIIFVTAIYNEDPFIRKGYEAGAVDYFSKPFDPEILKLKVRLYASYQHKTLLLAERERRIRETEELLQASRKLSDVLESLPVGVIIADGEGRICQTNEEATRIWGSLKPGEEDAYGEYLGWWDRDGRLIKAKDGVLSRALQGRSTHNEILNIHCFDGSTKAVLLSASPLFGAVNAVVGAVAVVRDVTEQKRIEEEMLNGLQKLVSAGLELEHELTATTGAL